MKYAFFIPLAFLFFISCEKNEDQSETDSYEVMQHPSWAVETFKKNYTIQFPSDYTGGRIQLLEGYTFEKTGTNDPARYWYSYPTNVSFPEFRDTLINLQATSLQITLWPQPAPILLNKRMDFTNNGEITGILFYNESAAANARLYLKHNGYFRESLDVAYRYSDFAKMIAIIRTIRRI